MYIEVVMYWMGLYMMVDDLMCYCDEVEFVFWCCCDLIIWLEVYFCVVGELSDDDVVEM